jgi:hypothetical protein
MQFEKLFKWALVLFLIYALFSSPIAKNRLQSGFESANNVISQSISQEKIPESDKFEGTMVEKYLSNVAVNVLKTPEGRAFFENLITPIGIGMESKDSGSNEEIQNKMIESLFKVSILQQGDGREACCGHIAQFKYEITDSSGRVIEQEQTRIEQLGARLVIPALENIIPGMKVGELRRATSPGEYAYDATKFRKNSVRFGEAVKIEVRLLDVQPNFVIDPKEIRIFDDRIAFQIPLLCGDVVKFRAKILKFDGTEIFNSDAAFRGQKIQMRIGDNSFPAIFSYGLHKKVPVGKRTIITPGRYFQSILSKSSNKIFPNSMPSQKEYFLLELYDIESTRMTGMVRENP